MSDIEDPHTSAEDGTPNRSIGRDILGLVLFAFAVLLGVSVFMAMTQPQSTAQGTTAMFTGLVGLMGAWPLVFLAVSLALLGGRLWVGGPIDEMPRHCLGIVLMTLAFSILAGASVAGAGGQLGDLVGGSISNQLTAFVGVPSGLAIVALTAWMVWLRPPEWAQPDSDDVPAPISTGDAESEGLTAAEAAALLPFSRREPGLDDPREPEVESAPPKQEITGGSIPISPTLPPLYPPDVRKEGGIPEGASPLGSTHAPAPSRPGFVPLRPPTEDAQPLTQPEAEREPPTEPVARPLGAAAPLSAAPVAPAEVPERRAEPNLAPPAPAWEAGAPVAEASAAPAETDVESPSVPPAALPEPTAQETTLAERARQTTATPEPVVGEEPAPEAVAELSEPEADVSAEGEVATGDAAAVGRPSWEQPGLFDEEPVDAYGTPESLIDTLRQANVEAAHRLADVEPEAGEVLAEADDEEEAEDEDEILAEADGEEDEGEDEEEEYEEDEVLAEGDGEEEEDEDEEEEYEEDEDEVLAEADGEEDEGEDEEEEYEEDEDEVLAEGDGEEEEDEDEEEEYEEDEDEVLAEADGEEEEDEDEEEEYEEDEDEVLAEADGEEDEGEDEEEEYEEDEDEVLAEGDGEGEEEEAEAEPEAAEAEPEVVLVPQAAPEPEAEPAAGPLTHPVMTEDDLVYRAGALFLERGRVAVSMLQREFGLDFKHATALLDELQQAGLIGPYLGGQRRDILLTPEEWQGRVSVS